jgi:hypothetical protein
MPAISDNCRYSFEGNVDSNSESNRDVYRSSISVHDVSWRVTGAHFPPNYLLHDRFLSVCFWASVTVHSIINCAALAKNRMSSYDLIPFQHIPPLNMPSFDSSFTAVRTTSESFSSNKMSLFRTVDSSHLSRKGVCGRNVSNDLPSAFGESEKDPTTRRNARSNFPPLRLLFR